MDQLTSAVDMDTVGEWKLISTLVDSEEWKLRKLHYVECNETHASTQAVNRVQSVLISCTGTERFVCIQCKRNRNFSLTATVLFLFRPLIMLCKSLWIVMKLFYWIQLRSTHQ